MGLAAILTSGAEGFDLQVEAVAADGNAEDGVEPLAVGPDGAGVDVQAFEQIAAPRGLPRQALLGGISIGAERAREKTAMGRGRAPARQRTTLRQISSEVTATSRSIETTIFGPEPR